MEYLAKHFRRSFTDAALSAEDLRSGSARAENLIQIFGPDALGAHQLSQYFVRRRLFRAVPRFFEPFNQNKEKLEQRLLDLA